MWWPNSYLHLCNSSGDLRRVQLPFPPTLTMTRTLHSYLHPHCPTLREQHVKLLDQHALHCVICQMSNVVGHHRFFFLFLLRYLAIKSIPGQMTGPGKIEVNSAATKLRWPNMQMYSTMNLLVFNGCLATINNNYTRARPRHTLK